MTTQATMRDRGKATEEFLSGKLAHVDIRKIEKELQNLWQSAAVGEGSEESHSITRACAMNLILFSEKEGCEQEASDLLDAVTLRHPCRAILAVRQDKGDASLEAWVSARCHVTDAKTHKQICCEQITVRGEGVGTSEMASVVIPLLVSDLPVLMWWHPDKLDQDKLQPFLDSIDKLIFDSDGQAENLQLFKAVLDILNSKRANQFSRKLVCSDLNWRRSLPWREAIALAFDQRHSALSPDYLNGIRSVEVRYGLPEDTSSGAAHHGLINQSLLVVCWMAALLGWRFDQANFVSCDKVILSFGCKGLDKVSVQFVGVPSDQAAVGDIGSISLTCDQPESVVITATQPKGMPGICVKYSRGKGATKIDDATNRLFELDEQTESHLIDKELETLGLEPTYCQAITVAVEVLEALAKSGATK
jgi:glucose-6-phosphate dehydrogenase assembly protein OpcA